MSSFVDGKTHICSSLGGLWLLVLGFAVGLVGIWVVSRVWGREGWWSCPRLYGEQFMADVVALVESWMTCRQVCAGLGVLRSFL